MEEVGWVNGEVNMKILKECGIMGVEREIFFLYGGFS